METKVTITPSCPKCSTEFDHNYTVEDFKTSNPVTFTCQKCGYSVTKAGTAFMEDFKKEIAAQYKKDLLKNLR